MDGALLQEKVNLGYRASALRVGLPYKVFRAASAMNPMAGSPLATLPAAFSPGDYKFAKPQLYGKATWQCLIDADQTRVGDILVGPKTYFIAAQQAILPILAVEAPRTVDVRRPRLEGGFGANTQYGGTTPATETVIMAQWPASILQGHRGEKTDVELPDDVKAPLWDVLMPAWPGVQLVTSDVLLDDLGRRLIVLSPELTPLGWRLTTLQEQA